MGTNDSEYSGLSDELLERELIRFNFLVSEASESIVSIKKELMLRALNWFGDDK